MTLLFRFGLFLLTLLMAGCRPDTVRPFNQQTATQVQKFGDDMTANSVQFLKGFPIEVAGATIHLHSALPVPPTLGSGSSSSSSIRPQAASDCGLPTNDPMRLDSDQDGIQANYNYTFNCSTALYKGFPALLTGTVKIVDLSDSDPTSGYDVTIMALKLEYTNAAGKSESVISSQTTKMVKLASGNYSVTQDFVFGSLVDGVPSGYRRTGTLTYSPLGSSNADRFAKGLLNGTTDFTFVENLEVRNYKLITKDLRVDQNKCGRDLAVDSGTLRFEYSTGDTLTWTLQDTNADGNACGEGIWTYNTTPLPEAAPASFTNPVQVGNASNNLVGGIASDTNGNSYFVVNTTGGLNGEAGLGLQDVALVKLSSTGLVLWTRIVGTVLEEQAAGVAIGTDGTVLVAGTTNGQFPGEDGDGTKDGFVAFYSPAGVFQKARQFRNGLDNEQVAADIAVDSSNGDIVVAATTQTSLGNFNLLLVKLAADGTAKWSRQILANAGEFAEDVTVDSSGNVYAVGTVTGAFLSNTPFGGNDIFLVKYDSLGVQQWAQQYGTSLDDCGFGLTTFSSDVFLTGCTKGAFGMQTNAGKKDIFLMKVDAAGTKTWVKQFGTAEDDEAMAVIADLTDVYISGTTQDGLDGSTRLGALASADVFVAKFANDSEKVWTKQVGSSAFDYSVGIAFGANNTLLVAGATDGSVTGVPNAGLRDAMVLPVLKTP